MRVAARNLGVILLALFGIGTPRTLQSGSGILEWTFISANYAVVRSLRRTVAVLHAWLAAMVRFIAAVTWSALRPPNRGFSTGC